MINNNLPKSKNADVVAPFNTDPRLISNIKVIEDKTSLIAGYDNGKLNVRDFSTSDYMQSAKSVVY